MTPFRWTLGLFLFATILSSPKFIPQAQASLSTRWHQFKRSPFQTARRLLLGEKKSPFDQCSGSEYQRLLPDFEPEHELSLALSRTPSKESTPLHRHPVFSRKSILGDGLCWLRAAFFHLLMDHDDLVRLSEKVKTLALSPLMDQLDQPKDLDTLRSLKSLTAIQKLDQQWTKGAVQLVENFDHQMQRWQAMDKDRVRLELNDPANREAQQVLQLLMHLIKKQKIIENIRYYSLRDPSNLAKPGTSRNFKEDVESELKRETQASTRMGGPHEMSELSALLEVRFVVKVHHPIRQGEEFIDIQQGRQIMTPQKDIPLRSLNSLINQVPGHYDVLVKKP